LVLVDTVVTDKKGAYIHDLTAKDFRVYEDGKEQPIKSFSFEADPTAPSNSHPHYMVLFFDNSSTELTDQIQARQAATKFIDTNAGPNRLMAIVNFGASLSIAQNFTSDAERLKKVVGGLSRSYVASNPELASMGGVQLSSTELDFGRTPHCERCAAWRRV
jgi:VWFA-related protein